MRVISPSSAGQFFISVFYCSRRVRLNLLTSLSTSSPVHSMMYKYVLQPMERGEPRMFSQKNGTLSLAATSVRQTQMIPRFVNALRTLYKRCDVQSLGARPLRPRFVYKQNQTESIWTQMLRWLHQNHLNHSSKPLSSPLLFSPQTQVPSSNKQNAFYR